MKPFMNTQHHTYLSYCNIIKGISAQMHSHFISIPHLPVKHAQILLLNLYHLPKKSSHVNRFIVKRAGINFKVTQPFDRCWGSERVAVLRYGAVTDRAGRGAYGGVSGRSLCGGWQHKLVYINVKAVWRTRQSGAAITKMKIENKQSHCDAI